AANHAGTLHGLVLLFKPLPNEDHKHLWKELLSKVDESDFSLSDWLTSIEVMQAWLKTHGKKAPANAVLDYIECTAASAKDRNGPTLGRITEEMLEDFGFVAVE